ncbi:hypothetical protein EMIT019CA3_60038 [Bacillus pseudomycoides]
MKPKGDNECRSPFGLHSRDLYIGKSKWTYIYKESPIIEDSFFPSIREQ